MKKEQVDLFLSHFTLWAVQQTDLLAAALVGSYARGTVNENSDVDLVLLIQDPDRYLRDQRWVSRFGEVASQRREEYGRVTSLRIWYTNGIEVEFDITGREWADFPADEGTRQVIEGGIRVLFERGSLLSRLLDQK